jgi:hypothetical protein
LNKRALLGLFSIASLVILFIVYVVLTDYFTRTNGYRMGVRFPSAAGLQSGSLVYESGVVVGSIDEIKLLPDYSSEVIIALRSDVNVPTNARFLIAQPLQGDPTLRIVLRTRTGGMQVAAPPFPHRVLPVAEQPLGLATMSLAEFLAQGQDEVARVDDLMLQFQRRAPRLLDAMQETLDNSTKLTKDADRSLLQVSNTANTSLGSLSSSSHMLIAQLSQSMNLASANLIDMTARMDAATRSGQPHIEHMTAQLDLASKELVESIDALHQIAGDPALHGNIISTTRSLSQTMENFSQLLNDLRKVTGNEHTQAQLRDVITNVDSASQKADSLLGALGGKSNVQHETIPAASGMPSVSASPLPGTIPQSFASPAVGPQASSGIHPFALRKSLVGVQVRMGELSPEHRDANGTPLSSRLLGQDRGPQTDITLVGLTHGRNNVLLGVNDIGYNSTLTLAAVHHSGAATYGGGILYSTLGVTGGVDGKRFGVSTNVYDPRRGTVDVYGKLFADSEHNTTIFAGERDATRDSRRDVFGLQFNF